MKLYNNTNFLTLDEYQRMKGLLPNQIGKYFTIDEPAIKRSKVIYTGLIEFLDKLREDIKKPIILNSLHRSVEKQAELTKAGYKTAGHSPHLYGCAADIDCSSKEEVLALVVRIQTLAKRLNVRVRIGYLEYLENGQTFVHIDLAPEVFSQIFNFLPFIPEVFTKIIKW